MSCPGCATPRRSTSPTPAASMPARMTWSRTMTGFSARSPARMMCTPGLAGAAPDTSLPRGWGGCSLSWRCSRAPCTTSAGSRPAGSLAAMRCRSGRKEMQGVMNGRSSAGIAEQLSGTVLGAEGYVFELERRGYIHGPYVPEVVLDVPEAVRELHREFLRGLGCDGRAHLLRASGEAAPRWPRARPRGDEPARRAACP